MKKLNVVARDSRSQDLAFSRWVINKDAKKHKNSIKPSDYNTQYLSSQSFLRSTFILSNDKEIIKDKRCIRSPKETGFKNFTKKLVNTRINGMFWSHNLVPIGIYRTCNIYENSRAKLPGAYEDLLFNINERDTLKVLNNVNMVIKKDKRITEISPNKKLRQKCFPS